MKVDKLALKTKLRSHLFYGWLFTHPTAIVDDNVIIGNETKVWCFSHILKFTEIGNHCNIGQNVVIGPFVSIGDLCKIQNNVSLYKGVTLEDGVFVGPSVVFTNILNPRSFINKMNEVKKTIIRSGATIGANATIVCGNTIGEYALVGAGSVVTRDVPPHALVIGNPARIVGYVCECGERLEFFDSKEDMIGHCYSTRPNVKECIGKCPKCKKRFNL